VSQQKTVLVYLGVEGGGLQLLVDTSRALQDEKRRHLLVLSKENATNILISSSKFTDVCFFDIPHSITSLLKPTLLLSNLRELIRLALFSISLRNALIVQIMPSPFDIIIDWLRPRRSNRVMRCIHDAKPHMGENWPTRRSIEARIYGANYVVSFSNFVSNQIIFDQSRKYVVALPRTFYSIGTVSENFQCFIQELKENGKPIVLSIGRGRDYKGLHLLQELGTLNDKINLVIAGRGINQFSLPENVKVIDTWLSDSEFIYLLRAADILVFTYLEASQSGTIPIAVEELRGIVTSNVGGLPEQVANYPFGNVFDISLEGSLLEALNKSLIQISPGNSKFVEDDCHPITSNKLVNLIKTHEHHFDV